MTKRKPKRRARKINYDKKLSIQVSSMLAKRVNATEVVLRLLMSDDLKGVKDTYGLVRKNIILRNYFNNNDFPDRYECIYDKRYKNDISIVKALEFCAIYLCERCDAINEFVQHRDVFEYDILHNKIIRDYFSEFESKFGKSLWLIENKINLLSMIGITEQKEYANSIVSNEKNDRFVRFVTHYYSLRAEDRVSVSKFRSFLSSIYEDSAPHDIDIISTKLDLFCGNIVDHYGSLMVGEMNGSLIDKYINIIQVLRMMIASGKDKEIKTTTISVLNQLNGAINDSVLRKLCVTQGVSAGCPDESSDYLKILDLYTSANYELCIKECERLIVDGKFPFELSVTFVKSIVYVRSEEYFKDSGTLFNRVLSRMEKILRGKSEILESTFELIKISYKYASCSWALHVFAFVREYTSIYSERDTNEYYQRLSRGSLSTNNPYLYIDFDIIGNSHCCRDSPSFSLIKSIHLLDDGVISEISGISKERKEYYSSVIDVIKEDFRAAEKKLNDLLEHARDDSLFSIETKRLLLWCLLKNKKTNDAVILFVNECMRNSNAVYLYPVEEIVKDVCDDIERCGVSSITYPIILDIYSENVSDDHIDYLPIAFEEYMDSMGLQRPSQLIDLLDIENDKQAIYFLRNVCKQSIMDAMAEHYDGSSGVTEERIRLCQTLIKHDKEREKGYELEIADLTKQLLINQLIQDIEKSKINVQIDGIKKSLEKGLKESFSRYKVLASIYGNDTPEVIFGLVSDFLRLLDQEVEDIQIPSNEATPLLQEMMFEIRDKFISSSEYGLDGALSSNIRHGTLAGQLRSSLVSRYLITQKDSALNQYMPNQYWLDKYPDVEPEAAIKLTKILNNFSASVDESINKAKNKWVQIKTDAKNESGKLDFRLHRSHLIEIQRRLKDINDYDIFIDDVIDLMWRLTDQGLSHLRYAFEHDYKDTVNSVFDKTLKELHEINVEHEFDELINAMKQAKTDVGYDVDRVASWFTRGDFASEASFTLSEAIDIAEKMIANINPNNSFELKRTIESDVVVTGKHLHPFVNIFYNLFDNIVNYSMCENGQIDANIDVWNKDASICLKVSNMIDKEYASNINEQVGEINARINSQAYKERISTEGGSGLPKIKKILDIDIGGLSKLTVDSVDNKFFVYMEVSKGMVEKT